MEHEPFRHGARGFSRAVTLRTVAAGLHLILKARAENEGNSDNSPTPPMPDTVAERIAPVFVARALTKIYRMGEVTVEALRGIDFDLVPGEFVVLLGPSGSGKSTLLNILGGLDLPTSGEVIYNDQNLTSAGEAALTAYRRTHVGFVFQFYNLIPSLTARENVALVTEIVERPMTPEAALAMVGLDHRLDHFPAQLSGGEQQRVAIARAIAKRPDVLLCDEPTGALDITTGIVVLDALERVNRELGTATVVITHNAAIAGMADRVVRLFDGRVAGIEQNRTRVPVTELRW
jgi:putative ABC transport system ATP-binding protein